MRFTILTLVLISMVACQDHQHFEITSNGLWQQLGYGKIFDIKGDTVTIYDICKAGCNEFDIESLSELGVIEKFTKDSMTLRKNIKTYQFVRLNELPDLCSKNEMKHDDPVYNFEILWNTFNENYCYFNERGVDWDEAYKEYRPQVNQEISQLELFQIMDKMLSSLNDGHVEIEVPEELVEDIQAIKNSEREKDVNLKPEVSKFDLGVQTQSAIINHYCKNINTHNSGVAQWGMMRDNIGYIQINAMWILAYYDIPEGLSLREFGPRYMEIASTRTFQRQDEINGAHRLMDSIISDLKEAESIVLDLRFNGGGKDEAALEIIGRFVDERMLISRKKAKSGNSFTNHQDVHLEPQFPGLSGKVYILTSHRTSSAAELGVLASLPYDNFIRIGCNTEGIFSDGLDKKLPNGWQYILSNEIYLDTNGNLYEHIGITPDIKLDYPEDEISFYFELMNQLNANGDTAIEKVLQLHKKENEI